MKRFVVMLICMIMVAVLALSVPVALAEGEACYIVPEGQVVYFVYRELDTNTLDTNNAIVQLPVGYTVDVPSAGIGSGYIAVKYNGLNGYISTTDFAKLTMSPTKKELPKVAVKLMGGMPVYRIVEGQRQEAAVGADATMLYLGEYTLAGYAYYAVQVEGNTGFIYYVLKDAVQNVTEITDTLYPSTNVVSAKDGDTSPAEVKQKQEFTWVRIVLIMGIIIPFITIVLMIIRPRSRARKQYREVSDSGDDYDGIDEV